MSARERAGGRAVGLGVNWRVISLVPPGIICPLILWELRGNSDKGDATGREGVDVTWVPAK